MDVPRDLLYERWPVDDEGAERHGPPPAPPAPRNPLAVNRWGDTAEDQRRRRRALVAAMRDGRDA